MHALDQLKAALADRYVVERLIGEGGMATVYLARDVRHNRRVALKVLKPDLGAIVGVERFLSEIEVTANLQHPNLLPLFDSGQVDGLLFYVMPYVEGESLRAKLEREKQLSVDDALRIATSVASALDYAHRHGVIHRDLKPENILLHDGQPLVADFGIALAVSNAGGNRITQTGLSLGTPQYMSPEQATGDRVIDARSDIYSLGAVTYEMLTGEAPHTGATSQAIIARVITEKPRSIRSSRPSVPPHVEAAIEHALEKLAPDRFATAREFSEALTGARAVAAYTASTAAQAAVTAVVIPGRARARELIAWALAAIGVAAIAWANLRPAAPTVLATPAEFRVELADSVSVSSQVNAAVVALSENGSMMVFQGVRRNEIALYSRRLDDRTVQLVRGTEGGVRPTLSPDGTELLFQVGSAIKRVSVHGGTARPLVDSGGPASWGENHQIVYSSRNQLFTVAEDGGVPRLIAAPDTSRKHVSYSWPHILPGGNAALIAIRVGVNIIDSARIGIVSLDDGRVTEFSPTIRGTNPHYSPTGHLMYATVDGVLFAVPFAVRSQKVTGAPIRVAEGVGVGGGGAAAYSVARGGTIAIYQTGEGLISGRELVAVSRTGVATPIGANPGYYQIPRMSPDGRQIALTVYTAGGPANQNTPNPDVWRLDLQSKVLTRVTTDSASARPAWSEDGERIAYVKRGDSVVMWRPLYASAQPTPLVRGALAINAIELGKVHGHVVVMGYTLGATVGDVFVAAADSQVPPRPLLSEPYNEFGARLTWDERLIAYGTNRTGRNEVYVRPFLANGPEVQVSNDGGSEPVWSRDGRELFYRVPGYLMSARFTDGSRLAVARRDTLFADPFLRAFAGNYDVFPDGKSFVMLRNPRQAQTESDAAPLIVLMNWRPGAASTAAAREQ